MTRWTLDPLMTAVVGVFGRGDAGIASRCLECGAARARGACNGFGEGCLVRPAPEERRPPETPD